MYKNIAIFLFLCASFCTRAQSGEQSPKKHRNTYEDILFSPGLIVQHETFLELNLSIGEVMVTEGKIPVVGFRGFRVGLETNLRDGTNHTIAPKIGYEISVTAYSIRLSAINYFQNGNSEFRILPELGLSLLGWVNLTYGYGLPLNNDHLNNTSCHRVGLSFNLDKRLSERL